MNNGFISQHIVLVCLSLKFWLLQKLLGIDLIIAIRCKQSYISAHRGT